MVISILLNIAIGTLHPVLIAKMVFFLIKIVNEINFFLIIINILL